MKCKILLFLILLVGLKSIGQDLIPVTIYTTIFAGNSDEWIHFRISNTESSDYCYDTIATVSLENGFKDTVYLQSGTYKGEIIDMGANVSMPIITLDNGFIVPYGYPEHNYYKFSVPGGDLNTYSTIAISSCESYNSPSSKHVWTESGTYLDTIPNTIGGDSIITINLTIISINTTITQTSNSLIANETDANYQWIACNSGISIYGATNQSYNPIVSGLYAVIITKNGCTSTSMCYSVLLTSLEEIPQDIPIRYYPNPTKGNLHLDLQNSYKEIEIAVMDIYGKEIICSSFKNCKTVPINLENYNNGLYFIHLKLDSRKSTIKVLKI